MYFLYSIAYSIGFVLMIPAFLLNRQKYASGFRERLGNYHEFRPDDRKVIWLHCVSVGETNAARPLVDQLLEAFPDHRLIVSTTTKTGQELARRIFADKVDTVFYFPFDWKFTVRRAIDHFKPSLVLLMETEIWPRLIHEAKLSGARIAIVNGRLSENSFRRYSKVRSFISRVLSDVDLALMQGEQDANRIKSLGLDAAKVEVTNNLKFDLQLTEEDTWLTREFRNRYAFSSHDFLIVAASTHAPEERIVTEEFKKLVAAFPEITFRLLVAPRHPERFEEVAAYLDSLDVKSARRSSQETEADKDAQIILLDTIGELRSLYELADIVFVGGSLIPHGGQSILEPAAVGRPIVIGPFTHNFEEVVNLFVREKALTQLFDNSGTSLPVGLFEELDSLVRHEDFRRFIGANARSLMNANRGASSKTVEYLIAAFSSPE